MKYLMRLTLVFALGLFFSAGINAQAADAVVSKKAAVMTKSLELSPDQTTKVETVLTSYNQKQEAIQAADPTGKATGEKLDALDASFAKELAGILTPAQMKKWEAMQPHG